MEQIKNIHQIWIGDEIPEEYKKFSNDICINHPEYKYKLWGNEEIDEYFKNDEYHQTLLNSEVFKNIPKAFLSNYYRMKILYDFGGWYIDTDCEYINPLSNIIVDKPLLIGAMNNYTNNGVIYSDKSEIANRILNDLTKVIKIDTSKLDYYFPNDITHFYGYNHLNQFKRICTLYSSNIQLSPNNYFYAVLKKDALFLHHKCNMSHHSIPSKRGKPLFK